MNKVLTLAAVITTVLSLQSCKKGENDPALSLRSRKARLTGEWKMSSASMVSTSNGTSATDSYNGTTWTYSDGTTETASYDVTFEKDGSFKIVSTEDGATSTDEGNWVFLGKNKNEDLKKKEAILLDHAKYSSSGFTSTSSPFNSNNGDIWTLDKLSNKEIIIHNVGEYSDNQGSGTNTDHLTITLTKK